MIIYRYTGIYDVVTVINFSPDGKQLASASLYKTIRLWDMNTGSIEDILKRLDAYVLVGLSYEFDINGQFIPKDYLELTKKRLAYAQKGLIHWLPDGGRGYVEFYENNLKMIEKFKQKPE
ncbi:MAG: hypothetical protein L3V56_07955 [Candidatus Magnetoovum sp. WYHC-5]|nr:hypothetical protein [Candidatus Magnetoovum sp. WYHC-5]